MFGWKTVGVKKFNLEKIPKREEINDILAGYPWLESSAISILTRYSYLTREIGKGGFGSAYLMEGPREIGFDARYVVKMELGHLERFPVWEAMVGAYIFAPQKDIEWRKKNRVPIVKSEDVLMERQKKELKIGDPFLHVADYYGVVVIDHSQLENFAKRVAKEAAGTFNYLERGWGTFMERAEEYVLTGLKMENKKLWQATEFAKNHPMVFSVMEYFEEGNISNYLFRSELPFKEKLYSIRVAFFQISETIKILSKSLGFAHGDIHPGNIFVRKVPSGSYSKMWYRTDDPKKSYLISTPPPGGISFALGDLGLNEIFDYPDQPYFSQPIRSPRHDLHYLAFSLTMLASGLAQLEKKTLPSDFVDLVRDLEGFIVSSKEYDAIAPEGGLLYGKERIKRFLQAAPKIDVFLKSDKVEDFPTAFIAYSLYPEAKSFDVDLGNVSEEVYERQKVLAEKITEIVDTPDVPFEAPKKTGKEFWKNVGKASGIVEF